MTFDVQEGPPKPTGERGTLLDVHIDDYRYLTPGVRYGFGIMTGNAYIESRIRFFHPDTSVWSGGASAGE
jgi:hypothetical protein